MQMLPHSRSRILYSRPGPDDRLGFEFDATGRLGVPVCHNCESGLISKAVSYRPEPLDQPAAGDVLICCSELREDFIIDL